MSKKIDIHEYIQFYDKIWQVKEKHKDETILYKKLEKLFYQFILAKPSYNRKEYEKIAELTSKIDFDCQFNKNGCKHHQYGDGTVPKCCCADCACGVGYIRTRFINGNTHIDKIESELLYYANKFDERDGFWRENKGCILPRKKRSQLCLSYNCSNKLTNFDRVALDSIRSFDNGGISYPLLEILKEHYNTKK